MVCAQGKISILPAGQKQARVTIPGILAVITPSAALDAASVAQLDAAIQAGVTGVVLRDTDDGDAAKLYDAALALKEAVRGRVPLLVVDRTDVAAAAEANGVILSDKGMLAPSTSSTALCTSSAFTTSARCPHGGCSAHAGRRHCPGGLQHADPCTGGGCCCRRRQSRDHRGVCV